MEEVPTIRYSVYETDRCWEKGDERRVSQAGKHTVHRDMGGPRHTLATLSTHKRIGINTATQTWWNDVTVGLECLRNVPWEMTQCATYNEQRHVPHSAAKPVTWHKTLRPALPELRDYVCSEVSPWGLGMAILPTPWSVDDIAVTWHRNNTCKIIKIIQKLNFTGTQSKRKFHQSIVRPRTIADIGRSTWEHISMRREEHQNKYSILKNGDKHGVYMLWLNP